MTTWMCWKWRNKEIVDVDFLFPINGTKLIWDEAIEFCQAKQLEVGQSCSYESSHHWEPPCQGWLKVNVDGSVREDLASAAAGGLARDFQGKLLSGFTTNVGYLPLLT